MNAPVPSNVLNQAYVVRSDSDCTATLTLNRGDRLNPLSSDMIAAITSALAVIATDQSIRAVVIAGAGRGFCAGHDMREIAANPDPAWRQKLFDDCATMLLAIVNLPQPVIARVHGVAAAAGCQLVSMCDLAVTVPEAKFALSGIHNGLFCSTPAVGVVRNVARKRAMEMLVTGDAIDAATALSWGLVNRVVASPVTSISIARLRATLRTTPTAGVEQNRPL